MKDETHNYRIFSLAITKKKKTIKDKLRENQDGGIGRYTAPPRTTRTDRKSNGKGVQHQGNTK